MGDTLHYDAVQHDTIMNTLIEKQEWTLFATLKPKLTLDGNSWCVLYGDDLQSGIVGFGNSPYHAMINWNDEMYKEIKNISP